MSDLDHIGDFITIFCDEHSLSITEASNGRFRIASDQACGLELFLKFESSTEFSFYFLERTYDVIFHGDRSDVHVVLSLMFTSFLRFNTGISCSLHDIPHPAVNDEIWGRYILPEQAPLLWGITDIKKLFDAVIELLLSIVMWRGLFWQFAGCPCQECLRRNNIDDNYRTYELPAEMDHRRNKSLKSTDALNFGGRTLPRWTYFYDIDNEITVIKSEPLSEYMEWIHPLAKEEIKSVRGLNGKFVFQGELRHHISEKQVSEVKKIFASLGRAVKAKDLRMVPLENMLVSFCSPYIVAIGRQCGVHKFKSERELLRIRHNVESELLFPVALFEWNEKVCPDQFEGLIKALLEREPNVISIKKTSPINQGDGGRDLMIEWEVPTRHILSPGITPTSRIMVVGQCKSSIKSVGKNKVLDIRDTVESYDAHGYFLAVSTQISAPLSKKLEELRSKGIWTEWWNRDDIEVRLSRNLDLLPLFSAVVKAKHQIKFVEQD